MPCSSGGSLAPSIVNVLPVPVWPYAKIVPFCAARTTAHGVARASRASRVRRVALTRAPNGVRARIAYKAIENRVDDATRSLLVDVLLRDALVVSLIERERLGRLGGPVVALTLRVERDRAVPRIHLHDLAAPIAPLLGVERTAANAHAHTLLLLRRLRTHWADLRRRRRTSGPASAAGTARTRWKS
eukprot:6302766-Prymnesium_polylepis.1